MSDDQIIISPETDQDSPEIEVYAPDSDDRESDRSDIQDALDIQPPQPRSKKEKSKKHRHKDERRKERHDRDNYDSFYKSSRKVKEYQKGKDSEVRRREKSKMERERLERLERERYKIKEESQRREKEHRERMKEHDKIRDREEREMRRRRDDRKRREDKYYKDSHESRRTESNSRRRDYHRSRSPLPRSKDRSRSDRYLERKEDSRLRDERSENVRSSKARLPSSYTEDDILISKDEEMYEEKHPEDSEEEKLSHDDQHSDDSDHARHGIQSNDDSDHESMAEDEVPVDHIASKFDHDYSDESDHESSHHEHSSDQSDRSPIPEDDGYLMESPPESPLELKDELPPYLPAIEGCRSIEQFSCLNRIEEGTYGVVYRAKDKKTEEIVALKKLKMEKEKEGFPITSLREINTLLKAQHENIVTVREIVVGHNMDQIFIVMDYVEHDIKNLMNYSMKEPFMIGEVKTLMVQLLRGVAHLHDNWIIHRDLKTSNLLLSQKGILKIGDFGLAREYGSPLKRYTPIVVTLWYRAPELLLGSKEYSTYIDMWSVGCIFAELLTKKPLFPGKSEIDQLNKIFKDLGTPNEKIWPGVSELPAMKKCTFADHPYNQLRNKFGSILTGKGFDLMNRFLTYNPLRRITAEEALESDYFKESPLPVDPSMFPTWPVKNEQNRPKSHGNSPKPPSGGKAYSKLMEDDDEKGFHLTHANKGASATGMGFALKF